MATFRAAARLNGGGVRIRRDIFCPERVACSSSTNSYSVRRQCGPVNMGRKAPQSVTKGARPNTVWPIILIRPVCSETDLVWLSEHAPPAGLYSTACIFPRRKLCRMTQKQGQICDKLCRKLCRKAVNPDSVGKFVGKTSGTLPHFRSSYKVSTVVIL